MKDLENLINKVHLQDNLGLLNSIPDNSIDLIYIDPPFYTQGNQKLHEYEYKDKWEDLNHYLQFIEKRLEECHRILKCIGSIYVHSDFHASHYLKCILDKIFGYDNFINEIIWYYSNKFAVGNRKYCRDFDSILSYSKSKTMYLFNPIKVKVKDESRSRRYRGYSDNRSYETNGYRIAGSIWEIFYVNSLSKERVGYPTQKPESLLERIVKTSSKPGDVVLDCFCGSGTTCVVAKYLNRKFIGCDINPDAIKITKERLKSPRIIQKVIDNQQKEIF